MYFNYPSKRLNVIGITGTKGKSTTAYFLKNIIDRYALYNGEMETAILSSIDTFDGIERFESHITTPESYEINRHMLNAINSGIKNIVMEVSSQALKYNRVYTLGFDYSVFLNIGEDHISSVEHENFEDYFKSKLKIFSKSNKAFINMDSDNFNEIIKEAKKAKKIITFSSINCDADIFAYNIHKEGVNTVFNVRTKEFDIEFVLTMPGLFNVENALAAIGVANDMGIPLEIIKEGLMTAKASGRMEMFSSKDNKISVLIDYAHNKLSFEKLYESIKSEYPNHRIVTIFGCPGEKALTRRKDLGLLSGANSDKIILTSEDPGKESAFEISEDIAKYVTKHNKNCLFIEDRGEALKSAIEEASLLENNTIILFTGKGRETRQKIGEKYINCLSDVDYALMFLKEYNDNLEYVQSKKMCLKF